MLQQPQVQDFQGLLQGGDIGLEGLAHQRRRIVSGDRPLPPCCEDGHQFPGQGDLEILKTFKPQGAAKAHNRGFTHLGGCRHFIDRGINGHFRLAQDQIRHFLQGRFQGRINPPEAD